MKWTVPKRTKLREVSDETSLVRFHAALDADYQKSQSGVHKQPLEIIDDDAPLDIQVTDGRTND